MKEMKKMFRAWAKRNDLQAVANATDEQPGTARLVIRNGLFSVIVCRFAPVVVEKRSNPVRNDYVLINADEMKATAFFAN